MQSAWQGILVGRLFGNDRTLAMVAAQHVSNERPKTSEAILAIHVMFDDVESKVIKAGRTPDCQSQQQRRSETGVLDEQQERPQPPSQQEQEAFEVDQPCVFQVGHDATTNWRLPPGLRPATSSRRAARRPR